MMKKWLIISTIFAGLWISANFLLALAYPDDEPLGVAPVKELIWNGEIEKQGQQATGEFHSKWVNFKDENNQWKWIDDSFTKTATGFEITDAPFEVSLPLKADGVASLNDNHRWTAEADKEITESPLTMSIQALGVNAVDGILVNNGELFLANGLLQNVSYVIYPNAYPEGDLIYYLYQGRIPKLEKLIRFNQALAQDKTYSFNLSFNKDPDFYRDVDGKKTKWLKQLVLGVPKGKKLGVQTLGRGLDFAPVKIWDSSLSKDEQAGKQEYVQADIQPLGNGNYRLDKPILASFFANATFPVFTDEAWFLPDPAAGANTTDGCPNRTGESTWALARDATAGNQGGANDTGAVLTSRVGAPSTFDIYRCDITFNTTTIEDNATIGSSSVRAFANALVQTGGGFPYAYQVLTRFGWSDTLVASTTDNDPIFDNVYSNTGANVLPTGALMASSSENSITVSSAALDYNNFLLTAQGQTEIASHVATCCAAFGFIEGYDFMNVAISSGVNGINWRSADTAGTSSDPFLVVTWTVPAVEVPAESQPLWYFITSPIRKAYALIKP